MFVFVTPGGGAPPSASDGDLARRGLPLALPRLAVGLRAVRPPRLPGGEAGVDGVDRGPLAPVVAQAPLGDHGDVAPHLLVARSEEHTSELQSRENLVCRLLLEKKKEAGK